MNTWLWAVTIAGGVTTLSAAVALAWRTTQSVFRFWRKLVWFLDDCFGEPARNGQPAKPGMLERIAAIENQLKPNGGQALRDRVDQIHCRLDGLEKYVRDINRDSS
jgi:hypothetical protein